MEELFETRQSPKGEAVITEIGGVVSTYIADGVRHVVITDRQMLKMNTFCRKPGKS